MTIDELQKSVKKLGLSVDQSSGKILVEWEKIPFFEEDRPWWAALSSIDGIGPATLPMLVAGFGSAQAVFRADVHELRELKLQRNVVDSIATYASTHRDISAWFRSMLNKTRDINLSFLVPHDPQYPDSLKKFQHGPAQLWVWGDPDILQHGRIVAVVGTRKITPYGKEVTTYLSQELANLGCAIVSGLMYGVDEAAMRAGLSAGAPTIGVWAGGLTSASLGSRLRLASDVVSHSGVVISEFSPDQFPNVGTFPSRNRIVSGLSRGVIITEGAEKSGSLITAACAMEQGKPVGVVPGPITSALSAGPNALLKLGAVAITDVDDIALLCGFDQKGNAKHPARVHKPKNADEKTMIDSLHDRPMTADELTRRTLLSSMRVGEVLTDLELAGAVRQIGEEWGVR